MAGRCQGVAEAAAAAFLATRPRADLDRLAGDLDALAAALPGFRDQLPSAELLWPVAGLCASVRGLGPLVQYLRRCAGADETLAALFLAAQDQTRRRPGIGRRSGLSCQSSWR